MKEIGVVETTHQNKLIRSWIVNVNPPPNLLSPHKIEGTPA